MNEQLALVPEYFAAHPWEAAWFVGWGDYFESAGSVQAVLGALLKAVPNIVNTIGGTGMAVGAFFALVLDNTIPGTDEERGVHAWMHA